MSFSDSVYSALPAFAQGYALSLYGLVLRSRRYGGIHSAVLNELLRSQWWTEDQLRALQLSRINALLQAARHVKLYRDRTYPNRIDSLEDICSLPFLTKDDLRRPASETVSEKSHRLISIGTGGTTGTPLRIYADRGALQRNYAFFERFKSWTGIPPRPRVATFAGRAIVPSDQKGPPYWRWNAPARTMLFSTYHLSDATLPDYLSALRKLRPHLIDTYPSALGILARSAHECAEEGIRPTAIITSSETLPNSVRSQAEEAFGCRIFDYYGSAEMAALITQCERGAYHVNPEYGMVELLDGDRAVEVGEPGEIVATGFVNLSMPLFRYRTGDIARWTSNSCLCGRSFPVIQQIEGRMDDVIVTPDGFRVGRLDPVYKAASGVLESRIVQDAPAHLRLELVPTSAYKATTAQGIVKELRKRVGNDMEIDVVLVPALPRSRSGKVRNVVNEVHERLISARGTTSLVDSPESKADG